MGERVRIHFLKQNQLIIAPPSYIFTYGYQEHPSRVCSDSVAAGLV